MDTDASSAAGRRSSLEPAKHTLRTFSQRIQGLANTAGAGGRWATHSPLPGNVDREVERATSILRSFIAPAISSPENALIPNELLARAKGIAVITFLKAGALWSGRVGNGVVIARRRADTYTHGENAWSCPAGLSVAGVGFGAQIGATLTDVVFLLMKDSAVRAMSRAGNITLGAQVAVAAGPIGRSGDVASAILNPAPMYSYSKSKGAFAGISLEGTILMARPEFNRAIAGEYAPANGEVTPSMLLSGQIPAPPQCAPLFAVLHERFNAMSHMGVAPVNVEPTQLTPELNTASLGVVTPSRTPPKTATSTMPPVRSSEISGSFSDAGSIGDSVAGSVNSSSYGYTGHNKANTQFTATTTPITESRYISPTSTCTVGGAAFPAAPAAEPMSSRRASSAIAEKQRMLFGSGAATSPVPSSSFQPSPAKSMEERARALFDYQGERASDLSFRRGDVLTILRRTDDVNDWWRGRTVDGREGDVPGNYLELI